MTDVSKIIEDEILQNDVVLFMKGDKQMPCCGFSATVVNILQKMNIDFKTINVLLDDDIRNGIKQFSDWPTIPQLYVKGEFIGGCDIIQELYKNEELQKILSVK